MLFCVPTIWGWRGCQGGVIAVYLTIQGAAGPWWLGPGWVQAGTNTLRPWAVGAAPAPVPGVLGLGRAPCHPQHPKGGRSTRMGPIHALLHPAVCPSIAGLALAESCSGCSRAAKVTVTSGPSWPCSGQELPWQRPLPRVQRAHGERQHLHGGTV